MTALDKLFERTLFGGMYKAPQSIDGDRLRPQTGLLSAPPSQGLPSGLSNMSAGIFDNYLKDARIKRGPTFMPPTMKPAGVPAAPAPLMGGGSGSGGEGGGSGAGGGAAVDSTPSGIGFYNPFTEEGRLLNDMANLYGLRNMQLESDFFGINGPGWESAPLDGSTLGLTGGQGYADLGGYGDASSPGLGGEGGGYGDNGPGVGEGTGEGGGWAKGGKVTKKRLVGPDPAGPDDGYGALNAGELVVPAHKARKLSKRQIAGLLGR